MKRHEGKVSFGTCWFIPTLKAIVHNTPQLSYFFVLVVPFSQKNLSQSITLLRRRAAVRTNSPKRPTLPPELRGKVAHICLLFGRSQSFENVDYNPILHDGLLKQLTQIVLFAKMTDCTGPKSKTRGLQYQK